VVSGELCGICAQYLTCVLTDSTQERIASLERELDIRRGEARELREESEEKNRKTQLLNEQLNKVKADCATRFSSDFEMVHKENRELKARAADLEYRLSSLKTDLTNAVELVKSERERSEVRLIAEVETLKARLISLKEEKARVERARQEAESRHGVMTLQNQQLTRELADTREALIEREHACDDSDRKVSELSAQLTIALSKQQQFFRQERELRATIERTSLERTRLERDASVRDDASTEERLRWFI
jgi:chromosome segregation ATPase